MTRLVGFVFHNWPLKLAAVVLASVLYSVFVLTQNTHSLDGLSIPIRPSTAGQPADLYMLTNLPDVTQVRYLTTDDGVRVDSSSFQATVDLSRLDPKAGTASVGVDLRAIDPRIQVVDFSPRRINLQFDQRVSRTVPVTVDEGDVSGVLDVHAPEIDPASVQVSGPASSVRLVDSALARVQIDPAGIDVNRDVQLVPVDASGEAVSQVDVAPTSAHIRITILSNSLSRTLPVRPNVTGTPAPGFEIAKIDVEPLVVTVQGDADQVSAMSQADTASISANGATANFSRTVELALPPGVLPVEASTIRVTVTIRAVTGSRTFSAGIGLVGARSDRAYALSTDQILVILGGSNADLDRIAAQSFQVHVEVGGLEVGTYEVAITANLPAGVSLVSASPASIRVTVSLPTGSPAPSASP